MILASGGDLASTEISHGNSTKRIFGIYPAVRGIYPPRFLQGTIVLGTVVSELGLKSAREIIDVPITREKNCQLCRNEDEGVQQAGPLIILYICWAGSPKSPDYGHYPPPASPLCVVSFPPINFNVIMNRNRKY